ncbi:MAG: type II secretion system F family protein, partial [Kiritimatiellae bacterium]|nr:type II secretion system F family protein [Kiritimatiellia bacterium]
MGYANRKSSSSGPAPAAPKAVAPAPAKAEGKAGSKPRASSPKTPGRKSGSVWNMQIGGAKQKTDMKRVEVLLFVSELADLLEAGMTLGQALQALASQGEELSAQRYVCQDLCDRIVRGESFSDACAHHPKTFPPLFSNMLRAGEASGAMVEVLRRLGDHYERDDNMRGKIKSALTYPVIVLVFGVFAVIAALVWIIPKFQKVFDSMGASLPLPTQILIGMSHTLIEYGWLMAIGLVIVVIWFRKWKTTPAGMRNIEGLSGDYLTVSATNEIVMSLKDPDFFRC